MDLDALRAQVAEHERRITENARVQRLLWTEAKAGKARWALRGLGAALWIEALIMVPLVYWAGTFTIEHRSELGLALPGLLLWAAFTGNLAWTLRQMVILLRLNYQEPVMSLQRRLAALALAHARYHAWALALGFLLWTPFLLVFWRWLTGLDPYLFPGGAWLLANLAVCTALVGLGRWLSARYLARSEAGEKRFLRLFTGYTLRAARDSLRELAEFETEREERP